MRTPEEIMKGGAVIVNAGIKDESRAQGHYLTGGLENSLSYVVGKLGPLRILTGTAVDYTRFVNNGVAAGRVPYSPGSRSGAGTSQYIEGLRQFWILRGKSDKEALALAFATANKHKQEGMPTSASKRYSSTGQRTGMIEAAMTKKEQELDAYMSVGFDNLVETVFQKCKSETI
ncbi:hypothetical protein [Chitinophaga sancti]|uniref:Uncharacterized protein n=1 Tax=Chitinophaga sancti TaxID=1004 RepID=A0A1K1LZ13_9BACT|nr:hypothetical protein [Chitinophaga sancti]WQD64743.1 hypothetical protein U0033_10080 [Chitinophaga sancti]WQG89635.1 hypothetical protein SR876_32395 [Chitinophaga sancti]SFW16080.1 hypothetical protein SAMN05661012_00328 [Chitinophaga sancti]